MATQKPNGVLVPQPNILDFYDQVTYNFKLYMLPQAVTKAESFDIDSTKGYVIAQSGVTGQMFIEDVRIKTVTNMAGPNLKNNTAINFEINIREFSGVALLDKIYLASIELGIDSYYKCPYFLELTFRGREASSSNPIDGGLYGKKWVWPLAILNIETDVDSGGASYVITTTSWDHLGHTDGVARTKQALTIPARTVGEAMKTLQKKLNEREPQEGASGTTSKADEYEIIIPKEWENWPFVVATESAQTPSRSQQSYQLVDSLSLGVEKNSTFRDAINTILASTEQYQIDAKQSTSRGETEPSAEALEGEPKILHRIDVITIQKEFDPARGDYQKKYLYKVVPYEMTTLHNNRQELAVNQQSKLSKIIKKQLLQKEYNYIFTGYNDQVIDFNMKFNFAWYANAAPQSGLFTSLSNAGEGKLFTDEWYKFFELRDRIQKYTANKPNAPTGSSTDDPEKIKKQIADANLTPAQKTELNRILETGHSERLNSATATASDEKRQKDNATNTQEESRSVTKNTGPRQRYVSDITIEKALANISADTTKRLIPVAYREQSASDDDKEGTANIVEGDKGPGRQQVNALFQQAFAGTSGDLIRVELTIKGDPFWLEPSPLASNTYSRVMDAEHSSYAATPNQANTMSAENYFLFRVKTPKLSNVATGLINSSPTTLDGVYAVTTVEHEFSNGKFTQVLTAIIDPTINMNVVDSTRRQIIEEDKDN